MMSDPRGSRADNGQGQHGTVGGLPECHFCGEEMLGFEIPDHVRDEHMGGLSDD